MLGPNRWPDLPGFREAASAYYAAVSDLARRLFRGFALALDLPEDHFEPYRRRPPSQLRMIHYPFDPAAQDREGIGAHTDYEFFTILRGTAPGLEVLNGRGEWIDAPPDPARGWSTIDVETRPEEAVSRAEAWCLGGSFLTPERPTYTAGRVCLALEVSAGHRASDLGLRCVTEAEGYLRGLPAGEALSVAERERVARVGQRWGPSASTLLARLQREGAGGAWVDALLAGASR